MEKKMGKKKIKRPDLPYLESQRCIHQWWRRRKWRSAEWVALFLGWWFIVVLNLVISSLSHYPGAGQMGKRGGSAPGIMLACIAGARWGKRTELLAGERNREDHWRDGQQCLRITFCQGFPPRTCGFLSHTTQLLSLSIASHRGHTL